MKINYTFADGTHSEVEVSEEIGSLILESRRLEENLERKERYHNISLDAIAYEGMEYADSDTPEDAVVRNEFFEEVNKTLSGVTETQRRRFESYVDGKSFSEIGAMEGVAHKQVSKSVKAVQEKLKKI